MGHATCKSCIGRTPKDLLSQCRCRMQERTLKSPSSRSRAGERGQALLEYAMIIALIGMGLVVMLNVMGGAVRNTYQRTSDSVSRQTMGAGGGGGGSGSVSVSVHPTQVTPPSPSEPPDSTGEGDSHDALATTHTSSH